MKTHAFFFLRSAWLLLLLLSWAMPDARTAFLSVPSEHVTATEFDFLVDGTQLVEETKQVVADLLNVTPAEVTASYCCQLPDGRYKYNASCGAQTGFVLWTVIDGRIIEDDVEGF